MALDSRKRLKRPKVLDINDIINSVNSIPMTVDSIQILHQSLPWMNGYTFSPKVSKVMQVSSVGTAPDVFFTSRSFVWSPPGDLTQLLNLAIYSQFYH